MFFTETYVGQD